MMFLHLLVLIILPAICSSAIDWEKYKDAKSSDHEYDINAGYNVDNDFTFNITINGTTEEKSFYLNALKMTELLEKQNVVATCRYVLFKDYKTFSDASASCKSLADYWPISVVHNSSSLADIYSYKDNLEVVMLMYMAWGVPYINGKFDVKNWVWINLQKVSDVRTPNQLGKDYNVSDYVWGNGSHPVWDQWMLNMPDQAIVGKSLTLFQKHVRLSKIGTWDDSYDTKASPYVCNYCGKYMVFAEHVNWWTAQELCTEYGLTFAMVNSEDENNELIGAINMTLGTDYSDPRFNNSNWVWIGVEEVMDSDNQGTGEWINHDNTTLGWDPDWAFKRQPDNYIQGGVEQRVVAISRMTGQWDDSFESKERPFACMCKQGSCY